MSGKSPFDLVFIVKISFFISLLFNHKICLNIKGNVSNINSNQSGRLENILTDKNSATPRKTCLIFNFFGET